MALHLKGAGAAGVVRCASARGRVRIDLGVPPGCMGGGGALARPLGCPRGCPWWQNQSVAHVSMTITRASRRKRP